MNKEFCKRIIENQIDFYIRFSTNDTQKGIAMGMIKMSNAMGLLEIEDMIKYSKILNGEID